ncbi:hypothetical protein G9A89_014374 [Geosiphon pyriformis]|nr:hypothetical protein G9A89_014374 [Geosiphon pyriformis]
MTQRFPQVQQPVESNPKEYKNESNNPITAQAKSTVNKKPRVLFPTTSSYHQTSQKEYESLFGNLTPAASQTKENPLTWEQLPAQNLAESASPLMKKTAILQSISSSDKKKQPALAPGEHSNAQTPISLNITSNISPINQIMAYWDIAKLEKFSGEKDNAYSWIANAEKAITANVQALPFFLTRTANSWYQSLAEKPTSFTKFKLAFLQYFCDLNTLIRLQNQFSIIKQKDHEAVTTYLGQFNQILHQILAIERDYYTMVQVLNQFIKELWSSILRSIRPCHLTSLQDAVTLARNFESAEQEVNHTQAVNLAINGTSDIDAKITQLSKKLTQKIEGFLDRTTGTYQPPQQRENNNNSRYPQQQNYLIPTTATTAKNLDTSPILAKHGIPIFHTSESTTPIHTTSSIYLTTTPELLSTTTNDTSNPSLSNFSLQPTIIKNGEIPTTIRCKPTVDHFDQFLIGFDKSTLMERGDIERISQPSKQTKSNIPPATIIEDTTLAWSSHQSDKLITALYTDVKVGGIDIKLILDSRSAVDHAITARIITADGNTKTLIGEIDNFPFEINGIQIPTKKTTGCQKPMLLSTGTPKNFNSYSMDSMPEFQLYTLIPPIIKTYQKEKGKDRAKEEPQSLSLRYVTSNQRNLFYQPPRLICVDCGKKLSTMGACIGDNKEWPTTTKYYCRPCKWDHTPCLACGKILPDEELWNDVPGRGETCDKTCQYIILINNWVRKGTLIEDAWKRALNRLDSIGPNSQRTGAKYYDKCDLMFNLLSRILFPITKLPEPEEEILITKNMLFQDPTEDTKTEQYLSVYDTDAGFDLQYPRQLPIIIVSHSLVKIDLKIALEIPVSTMVQVAFQSSLAKKKINVKGEIIDAGYTGNIIMMLQNNLDRPYKIESQEKIAQAIFLLLIKIPQLTPVTTREELGLTA